MSQIGLVGAPELGRDPLRERLPELDGAGADWTVPTLAEGLPPLK